MADDLVAVWQRRRWAGDRLLDALMRSGMVEVLVALLHRPVEMSFAQDQDEVKALSPKAAEESLANSVGLGCVERRFEHVNLCGHSFERLTVLAVVVPDQESRSFPKRCGFAELLGCPAICGVSGDTKMDQAARAQLDDNEDEHCTKEKIVGLKEVAGPNLTGVVA